MSVTKIHQISVDSLTLSKFINDEYLVTASDDGYVKLWKVELGSILLISVLISNTVIN